MILDLPDLQKLSGYKRAADVKRWLRGNGVAFLVSPDSPDSPRASSPLKTANIWPRIGRPEGAGLANAPGVDAASLHHPLHQTSAG
jgi:Domain of unknown function (DUF4224)